MKRFIIIFPVLLWFILSSAVCAQDAPITQAGVVIHPGPLATVPISAINFNNIGAISLTMQYEAAIALATVIEPNPLLGGAFTYNTAIPGMLVISWLNNPGISLPDGSVLFMITFSKVSAGTTTLTWLDNGISCEYATFDNGFYTVLNDDPPATFYLPGQLTFQNYAFNIILQKNTNCGEFSVKLKPFWPVVQSLSKITFTVKWAAVSGSNVQLTDIIESWPDLTQIGSRVLFNGNYYVTFSSATLYPVNWAAGSENTIMNFNLSGTGDGTADFSIIAADYDIAPPGLNTAYYIEALSINETASIINNASAVPLNCRLFLKDFLQGAYQASVHQMTTDLKTGGWLPLTQPYATTHLAYAGTESVISFTTPVVDWVIIELRSGTAANTMIVRQAALLLSNGNIVSSDQLNPPVFHEVVNGNSYYVVIYHRNHLPVMTSSAIAFPNTSLTPHDFTVSPATNVYGSTNAVIPLETGIYGQVSGDINMDNKLIMSGPNEERSMIFARISLVHPPPVYLNSTVNGYYPEDLNMNGEVRYSGDKNDQAIIFSNIDFFTDPTYWNTIYICPVPVN